MASFSDLKTSTSYFPKINGIAAWLLSTSTNVWDTLMDRLTSITSFFNAGAVFMTHDATGNWSVVGPNGANISTAGTTTQGLQEAWNYARANAYPLFVLGGGVTPPAGNHDYARITCTSSVNFSTIHANCAYFYGVDLLYTGANTNDFLTVDSFDDFTLVIDGQVIYTGNQAAIRLNPTIDNGESFIGGTTSRFRIQTIAVVNPGTLAAEGTHGTGIRISPTNGTILNCEFLIQEINGGLTGLQVDNPGAGKGFVYNYLRIPAIHQQNNYGVRLGSSSISGGSINANIWDLIFTGLGGSAKAVSTWGDHDLFRVSIGAASVGVETNSSALGNDFRWAWNNASTAYTTSGSNVNFFNGAAIPGTRTLPSVGPSPWTYQNTTGRTAFVFVSGTSSSIGVGIDGSTFDSASSPPSNTYYTLLANMYLKITYPGSAPFVAVYN